jgi:energy-coupling factor transporter ATP-binding protein EcfA2
MKIAIRHRCADFAGYRAARVKSLFNVESGADFSLDASLDIDDADWQIGVVVGPSGSGKTSIGRKIFGEAAEFWSPAWPEDAPIIDAIAAGQEGGFDVATGALSAVGLGSVPAWLRPYSVLSNGEKFRADMARLVCDAPTAAVVDEFTSVVDRQIARFGALAFAKAWRRTAGSKVVLLTPHYDVIDWLEPDWVFDTEQVAFRRGRGLWRRPKFDLDLVKTDWRYWGEFEPHHYLKMPKMVAACCYVGLVEGERVCHIGVSTAHTGFATVEARACRLVVKPEWQGAGVGLRFLNAIAQLQLDGNPGARLPGRPLYTLFHTSHPGLVGALRRDQRWRQISATLYGANKARSVASIKKSGPHSMGSGFGGHFRAVQGFRYYGNHLAKRSQAETAAIGSEGR